MGRSSSACERAHLWASLAVDGELSELERSSLRAHEATCADCARYRGAVAAVARLLRMSEPAQPSGTVFVPARRRPFGRLQLVAAAAAVAAALAAGSLAGFLSSSGTQTAVPSQASAHRLQIQQSLLAFETAHARERARARTGRLIAL